MNTEKEKRTTLTARVKVRLKDALIALGLKHRRSTSFLTEMAIEEYLKRGYSETDTGDSGGSTAQPDSQ